MRKCECAFLPPLLKLFSTVRIQPLLFFQNVLPSPGWPSYLLELFLHYPKTLLGCQVLKPRLEASDTVLRHTGRLGMSPSVPRATGWQVIFPETISLGGTFAQKFTGPQGGKEPVRPHVLASPMKRPGRQAAFSACWHASV